MLADDIKNARKWKGLTQKQLAELTGLSLDSIKGFERGSAPGPESLQRLRSVLILPDADAPDEVLLTLILPGGMQVQISAPARGATKR